MKKLLLIIIPVLISISCFSQKFPPRLDTLTSGKIIFIDEFGTKYDTFVSAGGKLSIIKDNKQIALFRREPKNKKS